MACKKASAIVMQESVSGGFWKTRPRPEMMYATGTFLACLATIIVSLSVTLQRNFDDGLVQPGTNIRKPSMNRGVHDLFFGRRGSVELGHDAP
jgi:hypothetical protein